MSSADSRFWLANDREGLTRISGWQYERDVSLMWRHWLRHNNDRQRGVLAATLRYDRARSFYFVVEDTQFLFFPGWMVTNLNMIELFT